MITSEKAECFILLKMLHHRFVGGRHTHEDNIPKGKPPEDKIVISSVLKDLKKRGLIIPKSTHDGIHVSLNPRCLDDIRKRLVELGAIY